MTTLRHPVNISKKYLIKLSIPLFFSNLAIPMVGVVDTVLMGHLENEKYLVATSIATSFMTMILWSFGFLRMGTTGLVAQSLGKGDYREIVSDIIRNLVIAIIVSLLIIFLQYFFLNIINNFFITSEVTSNLIKDYITIRVYSAPAELVLYVLIGLFLGLQKTQTSSLIILTLSVLNIIFSSFFVIILDLKVQGVALGTLVASYLTLIIFLIYSYYFSIKYFKVIPRLKKIFILKKIFKLFNINFNIFLRTILLTFSFFWLTYQSSLLGEEYVAVNSIIMQFILIASFVLDAYAHSTEGVVGYAMGRKSEKTFIKTVRNSFELSFFSALTISILYLIFFKFIINLLTDLEFIRYMSYSFFIWVLLIPPVASFCYQFDGIFLGTSHSQEIRNSMIASVAIYVVVSIYLVDFLHNHGLWLSMLLFMIFRSLTLNLFFFKILRKFK